VLTVRAIPWLAAAAGAGSDCGIGNCCAVEEEEEEVGVDATGEVVENISTGGQKTIWQYVHAYALQVFLFMAKKRERAEQSRAAATDETYKSTINGIVL
jgi:hypothetical protein